MRTSAPLLGLDVAKGLRERPHVSRRIGRRVLALAVRMIGRLAHDLRAVLDRALMMFVDVLDANEHRATRWLRGLRQRDRTVADVELRAMVRDAQPQRESERGAQPVDGFTDVRIRDLGDR